MAFYLTGHQIPGIFFIAEEGHVLSTPTPCTLMQYLRVQSYADAAHAHVMYTHAVPKARTVSFTSELTGDMLTGHCCRAKTIRFGSSCGSGYGI
jgi:hypothetical protein